ncbi:MAG: hypothetical protein ABI232_06825 [Jatrophihabitantaceae bacterium]
MRKTKLFVLVPVATVLLAGCASTVSGTAVHPTDGSHTTAAPSSSAAPNVKSLLLTVTDLPAGWSEDTSSDTDNTPPPSCLAALTQGGSGNSNDDASRDASFTNGPEGLPLLEETLIPAVSSDTASAAFNVLKGALNGCRNLSFIESGQKITGTIAPITTIASLGDASAAWAMTFKIQGLTLAMDVVAVQKGSFIVMLLYGNLGSADPTTVTDLAKRAVAKLP